MAIRITAQLLARRRQVANATEAGDFITEFWRHVFTEVAKLPPEEQDAIAGWLLKELESEDKWNRAFAQSQDALLKLGAEALAEQRQGKTEELRDDEA